MKTIAPRANSRTRLLSLAALLLLFLSTVVGLLFTHAPSAHAAEVCQIDSSTACVEGMVRSDTREPLSGVELQLTGPGGTQTTSTGDDGRWSFTVTETGEHTVTLLVESLPEGNFISQTDTRVIEVAFNKKASALFPLTADESEAATAEGGGATSSSSSFSWPRFWQQFISGIRLGLLISLASLGLSLIFGTTGISNFSQGEMVSLGGILAAVFMTLTGNLWLAGILAVAASAFFGYVQDVGLWRPLRKRRLSLMQLMIVSIGLSIFMQFLFQFFFGSGIIRISSRTPATINIGGVIITYQSILAMVVSVIAIIAVGLALMYTRFGRATRAISDNPSLAQASGINVNRVIRLVWIIGSGLAGLSGVFIGLINNGINWFSGGQMLLLFFAAVTLGGLGTAFGAFVGSMIIGMVVEISNIWLPSDLKYATALFILILILLVRPQGLFGRKERIG